MKTRRCVQDEGEHTVQSGLDSSAVTPRISLSIFAFAADSSDFFLFLLRKNIIGFCVDHTGHTGPSDQPMPPASDGGIRTVCSVGLDGRDDTSCKIIRNENFVWQLFARAR